MKNSRRSSIVPPKDKTRLRIEKMEAEREARRKETERRKKERAQEHKANVAAGNPGDVDFIGLTRTWRVEHANDATDYEPAFSGSSRLCVCVRKRPLNDKERSRSDHDSITCLNPNVWIHAAKKRVDGITKYLDHSSFCFDQAYSEKATTDDVYTYSTYPLLSHCCGGTGIRATVFCYGQTGSGKTYTMNGIQELLCADLFLLLNEQRDDDKACSTTNTQVMVSFFEFYGGHSQDLLNERRRLKLLEDGKNEIVVVGLREVEATDADHLKLLLEQGHQGRTTHQTEANDTSSRSHAICQICLRERGNPQNLLGKLSLVDLAGSERGGDTRSHNHQRRLESAEINTSLLTLKECIRALDQNNQSGRAGRVPYRGSKLTLLLKDCFTSSKALTTMIATVSPGATSADHSLNTLRYADRIKEKRIRKSPQRSASTSVSSLSRRPASLSPRRPVDTTNRPQQASNRRASSVFTKPSSQSLSQRRPTKTSNSTATARLTCSSSARGMGLQHSNSLQTAGSTDSRFSYRSAHVPSSVGASGAISAASSVDDELDSLLNDDYESILSRESDAIDNPPSILQSQSSSMFEPSLEDPQKGLENDSDDSLLLDPKDERVKVVSTEGAGEDEGPVKSPSSSSLQKLVNSIQEKHMRKIQENATLVSEEHAIQERVEKAKKTEEALDNFMSELESVLDLRESMIVELNESVSEYRKVTAQLQVVT